MVGSGPYRFLPEEFNAGARSAYERFAAYVPRPSRAPSYTAGPKVAHFDRVEWLSVGDAAIAAAALMQNEVDWPDYLPADQMPLVARNSGVTVEVRDARRVDPVHALQPALSSLRQPRHSACLAGRR